MNEIMVVRRPWPASLLIPLDNRPASLLISLDNARSLIFYISRLWTIHPITWVEGATWILISIFRGMTSSYCVLSYRVWIHQINQCIHARHVSYTDMPQGSNIPRHMSDKPHGTSIIIIFFIGTPPTHYRHACSPSRLGQVTWHVYYYYFFHWHVPNTL